MLNAVLQVWAGGFYLLNKIFFSRAERNEGSKRHVWMVRSWTVYLTGVPAWWVIFVMKDDWILLMVESFGAFSMLYGLVAEKRGLDKTPKWLEVVAISSAILGVLVSLLDAGHLTDTTQVLELLVAVGFLSGVLLLARQKAIGYVGFIVMNSACAVLMLMQDLPFLFLQQIASLAFVLDAFIIHRRKKTTRDSD